ncbi:hypothetical protein A8L45_22515 [Veronia pacifica]|uniref:Uncharacterized protein n=1 Tax=Veronia pacifica TaxID=1080227 RepID=A0A1C3E7M4_9GAMM|nr:hypothetical protein A8L45_22515 [Veronia pacifica]
MQGERFHGTRENQPIVEISEMYLLYGLTITRCVFRNLHHFGGIFILFSECKDKIYTNGIKLEIWGRVRMGGKANVYHFTSGVQSLKQSL